MNGGIYLIRNTVNGKIYVGSAVDFRRRWNVHKCLLRQRRHHCHHLQSAWNLHGENVFEFRKFIICATKDLVFYEQRAIDRLQAFDRAHGYNGRPLANSSLGMKHSDEARAKIRARRATQVFSAETRALWSKSRIGTKMPEGFGERVRQWKTGMKHTPEAKAKMSAWQIGTKKSITWREKRSSAKLNEEKVREIRALYSSGHHTQKSIATTFGIDPSSVSVVVSGKRWAIVE